MIKANFNSYFDDLFNINYENSTKNEKQIITDSLKEIRPTEEFFYRLSQIPIEKNERM